MAVKRKTKRAYAAGPGGRERQRPTAAGKRSNPGGRERLGKSVRKVAKPRKVERGRDQ